MFEVGNVAALLTSFFYSEASPRPFNIAFAELTFDL